MLDDWYGPLNPETEIKRFNLYHRQSLKYIFIYIYSHFLWPISVLEYFLLHVNSTTPQCTLDGITSSQYLNHFFVVVVILKWTFNLGV